MASTLKLADGTLIAADGRVLPSGDATASSPVSATSRSDRIVAVPTHREAQLVVFSTRRKLADLPDVPKTMNAISVVLSYTLFGLDDNEIAIATGLTVGQVANIKASDAFGTMRSDVVGNIIASEANDVRDLFTQHARNAAGVLIEGLSAGKAADRQKAADSILDRGGFRPNDVVEHRHKMEGGLTIEIIRKDDKPLPQFDMSVEE